MQVTLTPWKCQKCGGTIAFEDDAGHICQTCGQWAMKSGPLPERRRYSTSLSEPLDKPSKGRVVRPRTWSPER